MNALRTFISRYALSFFVAVVYAFLYIPIIILIVFSFNSVAFPYRWVSFTFDWYRQLFQSVDIWPAVVNSLLVASSAVVLSITFAVLFVFYSSRTSTGRFMPLFFVNVIIPEIVLAIGLLSLFVFFAIPLGLTTLIAGHTVIGLGFAIPIIKTRFEELDQSIVEASLDLGATIHQTLLRVVIPFLTPAIVAASLLVFIISFDDFFIAFFMAGPTSQTLSLYIFSSIRTGITPTINALSAFMILLSSILVILFCSLRTRARIW
ncbi:MAG: ABC transporter permease [Candidatus Babeliales bacterium]